MGDFYTFDKSQQPKVKKDTAKFYLPIGVILILISMGLSIVSGVITLGGIARLDDNAVQSSVFLLGPVVVILILSALILATGKNKRGRNFLVFSILALLLNFSILSSSINAVKAETLKEKVAVEKIMGLVKDFVAQKNVKTEDVSEELYGKTASLIEAIQNNYLSFQKIRDGINSANTKIKDPIELFKEASKDPDKIKENIAMLEQTSKDITQLDNDIKNYTDKFKEDISNSYVSGVVKDEIMTDVEYTVYTYADIISNNLKYMNEVCKNTKNLLSFLDEKQGEFKIKNDQIIFGETQDTREYNELYKLFDKAVAENYWNSLYFEEVTDEKIKELEKVD